MCSQFAGQEMSPQKGDCVQLYWVQEIESALESHRRVGYAYDRISDRIYLKYPLTVMAKLLWRNSIYTVIEVVHDAVPQES
jgi:hypothetical protein